MSALRLLRVHRGIAAVPAVLALSAALLLGGLPRIFEAAFDRSARDVLTAMPARVTDLTVTFRPGSPGDHLDSADRFAALDRRWRAALPPPLAAAADGPRQERLGAHYGARTYDTPVSGRVGPGHQDDQYVNLAWLSGADRRVRYVEGSAPGPPRTVPAPKGHPEPSHLTRFDIGLAASAAEEMDLPVGTVLLLGNSDVVEARVTGLFEPVDARDRYWRIDDNVLTIRRRITPGGVEKHITALIDPAGLASLRGYSRDLRYAWTLVADPAAVTSRAAPDLIRAIGRYRDHITAQPGPGAGTSSRYTLDTGLDRLLAGFRVRLASAQALMYLTLAALAGVALGVIALAVRLLAGRMRGALGLARARGASLTRVTAAGTGCVALATAPAALLGHGLAHLVPGPATLVARLGPPLIAVATAALAAGTVAAAHRRPPTDRRADVTARLPSPRRIAAEALIVLLALGGVYLLRTRGLTTGPNLRTGPNPAVGPDTAGGFGVDPADVPLGADPLLVLVPVVLTIAAALVVVRCHPHLLRLLVRLAGRRPSAVPFLGLAMAARSSAAAALPALILLPALAVSVFGAVVTGALGDAQRLTAWRETGADARVEWEAELPADLIARVRDLPGVRAVVPAVKDTVQIGYGGRTATIVAIDLAAYRRILAGTPLSAPAPPAGLPESGPSEGGPSEGGPSESGPQPEGGAPAVPALVSPDLAGRQPIAIGWHNRMTVVPEGLVKGGLPGVAPGTGTLIVVPYDTLERAGLRQYATMLLVQGARPAGVDQRRLQAAVGVPQILVATVGATLRDITGAPLAGAVELGLRVVTVALAAYAITAVLITLVAGAAARGAAVTLLRTLGLAERQARTLTVLEIAPLIVLTAVAGLALGLALPAVLGPGLDLSPYIGPAQQSQGIGDHPLDPTTPVLLAAGLTAAALLGAFVHAAATRRRSPGGAPRDGEIGDIT